MAAGRKEKVGMGIGLGLALGGTAWFLLALAGALDGVVMMLGYFLGVGLAFSGLIGAAIYFSRWRKIRRLLEGKGVLANWTRGGSQAILAPGCALVNGQLVVWDTPGARLEAAEIERGSLAGVEQATLRITLGEMTQSRSETGAHLWRTRELTIPIPEGEETKAQAVREALLARKT